jgi:choline kinase
VVLAAGLGSRLGELTVSVPKPLLPVAGRPLVTHTLDALYAAGVEECLVVTGYREELVRDALRRTPGGLAPRFVSNGEYWRRASSSLAAARESCGSQPFLLLMSDHAVDASLIQRLLEQGAGHASAGCGVAADYGPRPAHYVDEATKLQVAPDGRVTGIGKTVTGWQALDAGAFYCTPEVWAALDAVGHDADISDVFGWLAIRGRLRAADITGSFWYDIDTGEDLAAAEALVRAAALAGDMTAQREKEDLAPA